MKRIDLLPFEGISVILTYRNKVGTQIRTGLIYAVALTIIVFWPEEEQEIEVYVNCTDIDKVEKLNK